MSSDRPMITLRSTADLIAMAPYLIGYVPDRRLIIVGIGDAAGDANGSATGNVKVSSTVEIPPPGTEQAELAGIARDMVAQLRNASVDAAYVLAYGDGHAATRLVDAVRAELVNHGVAVRKALRIHDGRYWTYTGTGADAGGGMGGGADRCPPEGVPVAPVGSHVAAEAAMAGEAPFSSRSAVAGSIAPITGDARAAMRAATMIAEELLNDARTVAPGRATDDLREASFRFLPYAADRYATGGVFDDVQAATLAIAIGDVRVRGRATCLAAHGDTSAYLAVWTDLARRVEPAYRVPVLVLLAFTAWRDGGGPLPSIAIDEALRADPGHRFARVMREVLAHGIPATEIDLPAPGD